MRREISYLSVMAVAAPLAVSAPNHHATEITISGGVGSYADVARGCNGEVISKYRVDLRDAAIEGSHKFPGPIRLGARAGLIEIDQGDPLTFAFQSRYVNPYVSFDWPAVSIGVGYFRADHPLPEAEDQPSLEGQWSQPSAHVRIGRPSFYFSTTYLEEVPVAGAGYVAVGFGKAWPKVHGWLGTGAVPFDNLGLVAKADVRVLGGLAIGATGRLGSSEGVSENSFGLRLTYLLSRGDSARAGY